MTTYIIPQKMSGTGSIHGIKPSPVNAGLFHSCSSPSTGRFYLSSPHHTRKHDACCQAEPCGSGNGSYVSKAVDVFDNSFHLACILSISKSMYRRAFFRSSIAAPFFPALSTYLTTLPRQKFNSRVI